MKTVSSSQASISINPVFVVCPSRGLPKDIKIKVMTTFVYFKKKQKETSN